MRSVSPRGRRAQLQSADERRAVGRARSARRRRRWSARSGAAAAPGPGAHAAPPGDRGAALPGHRDLLLARRLALASRLIYFFPHLYFDPLGFFFFPPFPTEPSHAPVPSLSIQLGFFFLFSYITILIFFF